jgi:hypothetical protein
MSKRTFLLGACVAVLGLAFAFTNLALSTLPGVTWANCGRIRPGMTLQDVEELLGGQAGPANARAARLNLIFQLLKGLREWDKVLCREVVSDEAICVARTWHGSPGTITVLFNEQGQVKWAEFEPAQEAPLLDRLRSWVGR